MKTKCIKFRNVVCESPKDIERQFDWENNITLQGEIGTITENKPWHKIDDDYITKVGKIRMKDIPHRKKVGKWKLKGQRVSLGEYLSYINPEQKQIRLPEMEN